jgi:hypothetical protein
MSADNMDHHAKRKVIVIYTFKYRAAIEILPISQKLFTALSKQDIASALKYSKGGLVSKILFLNCKLFP